MSRSGGQSEARPPEFKSPNKLGTQLSTHCTKERNWGSRDKTKLDTRAVFGLKWRPIMISRAVAELSQLFRVTYLVMNPPAEIFDLIGKNRAMVKS
ncbi:hypothetical protein TNCV_4159371 [Trichonephila clavipes]|nr:hypothetical protein TNCV_4159371 [Trichonephila clavipes]